MTRLLSRGDGPFSAIGPREPVGEQRSPGGERTPQRADCGAGTRDLLIQLLVVAGAALLYFGVRGLTEGNEEIAVKNAESLLRIEEWFGLAFERSVQAMIVESRTVVTVANWVYIWGHWPVIISVLIWLYVGDRDHYRLLLRAMLISGGIGLIIFAVYPVSPPRLMPDGEIIDTVSELSRSYRVLQPPALVNKYAALPSLHVGWNLLVGIVVFRAAHARLLRALAVLSPVMMLAAVVLTGNHYVIDGIVGSTVAIVGLVAAWWMARRVGAPPRSLDRRDHTGDGTDDLVLLEADGVRGAARRFKGCGVG